MKKIVYALIALVIVAVLFNMMSGSDGPTTRESITIADGRQPVFSLLYIADENGYFDEVGLDVDFKSFTSGRDALNDALAGGSDIATVYETPVVLQTLNGEEVGIVGTLHNSTRNTALIARRDRGINAPSDLAGKTIGVPLNTNADFFLSLYLTSQGILPSEVTRVNVAPNDAGRALEAGEVDAIAIWNPHLYNTQQGLAQDNQITFHSDIYTEISMLTGRRSVIEEKDEAFSRLLAALVRAETYLNENPEAAQELVIEYLPEQNEKTVRATWDAFDIRLVLDNLLLTILQQESAWFISNGTSHEVQTDFKELIISDYLEEVNGQAVTIL